MNGGSKIDNQIKLNFIEPLKKTSKNIDCEDPFKRTTVEFSLAKELEKKASVYVIDFMGEGLCSRAVINRGSIVALKK